MKSNVVLIGFMGVGKSITGKLLAQKLGYNFIDTDTEIEKRYNQKIRKMFDELGEPVFRQRETETIKDLAGKQRQVISTGGGVATKKQDMEILAESSIIISLTATPQTIFKRTNNDKRPLLASKSQEERLQIIKDLMEKRAPFYQRADLIIPTDHTTPLQNVEKIIRYLKTNRK